MSSIFIEHGQGNLPRLPAHQNPGLELSYLQRGRLTWQCEDESEIVPPESLYFTLPWQRHGSVSEFEPGHYWYFIVIRLESERPHVQFPAELGFDPATEKTIGRLLTQARGHVRPASELTRLLMPSLVEELEHPGLLHGPRVMRMASLLILELALHLENPELVPRTLAAPRFARLMEELQGHCAEPWTLEQMASRVRLGPTHFTTLFRQQTGDSPMHYIQRLRIDAARKLLRTTNRNITDIAMECGFSSSQHLAHVFKQFIGVTASAYRQHGPPELVLPRVRAEVSHDEIKP